jgi:hypothetical protein
MTKDKDLKRVVRTRMRKTGESYTAARAQVLRKRETPPDYAALAGYSDATIEAKTGSTWARWVKTLDGEGAAKMSHGNIAALVYEKHKVSGWWSQAVTVGYERIKGLRALGQRRDGSFEATKSRTFNVPVATLFEAWKDASIRRQWLNGAKVKVRTAAQSKSMRLDWADGNVHSDGGIIAVGFMAKGKSKSAVAVQHPKLPDRETAHRLKTYWSERFDALSEVFAAQSA